MESTAWLRNWVLLALIVVPLVLSLGVAWYTGDWGGLALNLCTELIGAAITYYLFNMVIGRMEALEAKREAEMQEREATKAALIAQLGSQVRDVAVAAAEELGRQGWHCDGSLQGAFLAYANLQGAFLASANLQGACLCNANLRRVHLLAADLQEADLQGANLEEANFDENTTVPDGTRWTPDTDMARFTDPDHPDFWRPDA